MYLDDGVSRSSAPSTLPQNKFDEDSEAADQYREVVISHVRAPSSLPSLSPTNPMLNKDNHLDYPHSNPQHDPRQL